MQGPSCQPRPIASFLPTRPLRGRSLPKAAGPATLVGCNPSEERRASRRQRGQAIYSVATGAGDGGGAAGIGGGGSGGTPGRRATAEYEDGDQDDDEELLSLEQVGASCSCRALAQPEVASFLYPRPVKCVTCCPQAEDVAAAKGIELPADFVEAAKSGGLRAGALEAYVALQASCVALDVSSFLSLSS